MIEALSDMIVSFILLVVMTTIIIVPFILIYRRNTKHDALVMDMLSRVCEGCNIVQSYSDEYKFISNLMNKLCLINYRLRKIVGIYKCVDDSTTSLLIVLYKTYPYLEGIGRTTGVNNLLCIAEIQNDVPIFYIGKVSDILKKICISKRKYIQRVRKNMSIYSDENSDTLNESMGKLINLAKREDVEIETTADGIIAANIVIKYEMTKSGIETVESSICNIIDEIINMQSVQR